MSFNGNISRAISDALEFLRAKAIKDRKTGLDNLTHVLQSNRESPVLHSITARTFQDIFEVLLEFVVHERNNYIKSQSGVSLQVRTKAANRLTRCCETLRLAVECGARIIRLKMLKALLDHLTETLIDASGDCYPLMAVDYAKCLSCVLAYEPHVEHLREPLWRKTALFCLDRVASAISLGLHEAFTTVVSASMSVPRPVSAAVNLPKQAVDDFVGCLRYLTSPPSIPMTIKDSARLLTTLLQYLDASQLVGQSQIDALTAVNSVLIQIRAEKTDLTKSYVHHCVQISRKLWHSKLVAVKNEILVMLVLLHPYILQVSRHEENPAFRKNLDAMVDTMRNEYARRDTRDQLRMDDLRLAAPAKTFYDGLHLQVFSLRDGTTSAVNTPDGEHNWTLLRLLTLFSLYPSPQANLRGSSPEPQLNDAKKRLKLSHWSDELLRSLHDPHVSVKISSLQSLCFATQAAAISPSMLEHVLERLPSLCTDENGQLASWALISLASCATQLTARSTDLSIYWASAWHAAARSINSNSTCRASAHLMHVLVLTGLVGSDQLLETCDIMISSIEVNGPSALSDSVISLLATVITRLQQRNLRSSQDSVARVLTWLFRVWGPSNFRDKILAVHTVNIEPLDILGLIDACLDRPTTHRERHPLPIWGSVAQAWLLHTQQRELIDYLLLVTEPVLFLANLLPDELKLTPVNASPDGPNESLLLRLSAVEVTRTMEQLDQRSGSSMSFENVRVIGTLIIVASCIGHCHAIHDIRRASQLRSANDKLLDLFFQELSSPSHSQHDVDALLYLFAGCMVLSRTREGDTVTGQHHCVPVIAARIVELLERRNINSQADGRALDQQVDDGMDLDTDFGSQTPLQSRRMNYLDHPRKLVQSACHITTQRVGVAAYATLVQHAKPFQQEMEADESGLVRLTTFLTALANPDLLASLPVISILHDHVGQFGPECTRKILIRIMDGPLGTYENERSEVTHALLLEVMLREIGIWTDAANEQLYDDGTEVYRWFTETALKLKMLSSSTQKMFCRLLLELLQIDQDYGTKGELPSIKSTVFGMLQNSRLDVGYYLSENMSSIFGLFNMARHDEIFSDLDSSLPKDLEWTEGIAIRLFALAHLASSWPSLLQHCIYGIFDTAGLLTSSTDHATFCVVRTSKSLGLQSPQELFRLFAPQLLYTWLDVSRPIEMIPFEIFEYATLVELLEQNLQELYSQLVVFDRRDEIKWLTESLHTTEEKVVRNAFAKAIAYAMSWDIVFDKEGQHVCESRLRNVIKSKSENLSLALTNFPYIVAQICISSDQGELVDKALEKRLKYAYATDALKAMKSYSSNDRPLPTTQQPCFTAKFLPDQMDRAARRLAGSSQQEVSAIAHILTPSTLTVILRTILDTMHPALGPLHACQIVRKLRILIAFAGVHAVQGYPLELLLRALCPLAVDSHCADDVIGILHYLLEQGATHLKSNTSTLTSISLSLLLTMKSFMVSRHDRTTQESQFRSTISRMQIFHEWLVEYLLGCQTAFNGKEDGNRKSTFIKLVQACRDLSLPASADTRNPASSLLQAIMDDEQGKMPVLGRVERKQVVSLLCRQFEMPSSNSRDILGSDLQSIKYAKTVWSTTRSLIQADHYETWAASVLGRAYVASLNPELIRPTERLQLDYIDKPGATINSTQAIVAKIQSLLLVEDRAYVSVAERALRKMVTTFIDVEDHDGAVEFENLLPPQIVEAMSQEYVNVSTKSALGRSSLLSKAQKNELVRAASITGDVQLTNWIRNLAIGICKWTGNSPIVGSLVDLLDVVADSAQQLFPFILHLALQAEQEKDQVIRAAISESFSHHFKQTDTVGIERLILMLDTVLFLLTQPISQERTRMDRLKWLDIDYLSAAKAAAHCKMPSAALYLIELASTPQAAQSTVARSRRVSIDSLTVGTSSNELLLEIYKTVNDPDSFYGVQQAPSLQSVMDRVDHEKDGLKGMILHSARMDASMRRMGQSQETDSQGIIRSMGAMNLNALTHDLLNRSKSKEYNGATTETMLDSARKLQQWDIVPHADSKSSSAMLYSVCRSMSQASSLDAFKVDLSSAMRSAHRKLQDPQLDVLTIRSTLSALAVLTEIDELTVVRSVAELTQLWELMQKRQQGWDLGRFDDARHIISYRETIFGILSKSPHIRESLHIGIKDSRAVEVKAVVKQSEFARKNDLIQQSLTAATYLSELVPACADVGVKIDVVAQFEAASILWMQGEISSSVQMLQSLRQRKDLDEQTVTIGSAGLLAQLGHEIATARLENPEVIISSYLKPAIAQLGATKQGSEAGRVFHEFASFCDQQLQNADNLEDFQRLERLSQRRRTELEQYSAIIKSTPSSQKEKKKGLRQLENKAQSWYTLDNQEYQKARKNRDDFVQQSLKNYLHALQACDDFNSSVVRFFALWLENADSPSANEAVQHAIHQVPSWKFVGLTNQLTSRLLDDGSDFQKGLSALVIRMCVDHPYHMTHTIYAGASSAVGTGDEIGASRKRAATKIRDFLGSHKDVSELFKRIWQSCRYYVSLAHAKVNAPARNQKIFVQDVKVANDVDKAVRKLSVPPATLNLDLRPSADYYDIPLITRFRSEIKIAGGLSAPKILTAMATDGKEYKQLFKGGNDDLRQDAIMEQVFGEVSKMLQNHKNTRQRNISVRTYKVIPLTASAGIIEFVPHSLPLAEFLNPAHARYHPTDMKTDQARSKIGEAARMSKDMRYKAYKEVTAQYQPVLRHFFFERFNDPDEWFARRLAYTRSTAAISILGWVLGLGDRHTQNILLDEKSGEAIHIDLGVAFEAGRVLPIPEVVPFRMTRDIVDGMGITKTEGTFRRCCEFTMEALREEKHGIMTLLNVLRYDPLYSWTLSPIRAKRIQQGQDETGEGLEVSGSKKGGDEAGEADRALSVVEKKLSKTLSVAATVNELIQQATDERNLAVLFQGWAAYA